MTSWANLRSIPSTKHELSIRSYYESTSDEYVSSLLGFLYAFVYCQKTAEPFYIRDSQEYFQPLLKFSPILHYLKETPSTGTNLGSSMNEMAPIVNSSNLSFLRRTIQSVYVMNPETVFKIDSLLSSTGLNKQVFDVGIVLDISGCVPSVIHSLKELQKRLGKQSLKIFVMTDRLDLLQEFAKNGDSSWSYISLMRHDAPTDKETMLFKTLSELFIMRKQEYLVLRLSSSLGKLLYLINPMITMDSQIVSIDGSVWKAIS